MTNSTTQIQHAIGKMERYVGAEMSAASKRAIIRTFSSQKARDIRSQGFVTRPFVDAPPNKSRERKWVNAQGEERTKSLFGFLAGNISYIDQEQFEFGLDDTVEDFNGQIKDAPYLLVLPSVRGRRSEWWTYGLAVERGLNTPRKILELYKGCDMQNSEMVADHLKATAEQIKRSGIADVVFMDDVVYSANRILSGVNNIFWNMNCMHDITLHIIAPFMARIAEERILRNDSAEHYQLKQIRTYHHHEIRTISDVCEHEPDQWYWFNWLFSGNTKYLALTYFQHKVPDYASMLGWLSKGQVFVSKGRQKRRNIGFIPEIIPPYTKNYLEIIRDQISSR
ncbi:MAG: hypothetical protein WC527_02995 [Candidatus Margulisiibacteriota bacterium]